MIIDSHVHIGKTEKTERYFTLKSYYDLMKKSGIDKAVVMPNLSNVVGASILNEQLINEYLSSGLKEKFHILIVIDPKDKMTLKQIDIYKNIICGLKYHPSISEITIDSPEMNEFLDNAFELNLPILVHCGRHWRSDIKYLIKTAKKFETINFIAAHLGGNAADLSEKAIKLIKSEQVNNIYLDTSNGKLPWLIKKAVDQLGKEKILFGSDEPYADIRVARHLIYLADIDIDAKEYIFHKNTERLIQ